MKIKDDIEVIASLVEKLMNGFHAFVRKEVTKEGLSLPQHYILYFLSKGGKFKMSDLKKRLSVTGPFITSLTNKLLEKGFIIRQRNIQNRRSVNVSLTAEGMNYAKRIEKRRKRFYDSLLKNLSIRDRKTLKDGLSLFVSCFETVKKEYV